MPQTSSYDPGNREPAELVPTRALVVLLVLIVVTLLALLVVPQLMKEHTSELRREISELIVPLDEHRSVLVRELASEATAIRGYVHTGDEMLLELFQEAHSGVEEASTQLRERIQELEDEELNEAVDDLLDVQNEWTGSNSALSEGSLSREEFQEILPLQHKRFLAILRAEHRLDQEITRAAETRRQAIIQAERRGAWYSAGLAILAILSVGAVLWLGQRLHAANRRLQAYAHEQARLVRITQLLNEATNLEGALKRIARGVLSLARAQGVHVEQIDVDRDVIEVVSTAGKDTPAPGTTAPYSGSLTEKVITSGESEVTTVDSMVDEDQPMAPHLAASCPRCQLLVVPLFSEDAALGALLLNRPATDDAFDADEVARIRVLADMAALVLQRLSLFEKTRRNEKVLRQRTAELRELNETLEERVERRTKRIRELASQLTMAEQKERQRIAQVLHDDLQQRLYGIQMRINFLQQYSESGKQEKLLEEIKQTKAWIKEAISTTRRLSVDLSPPVLKKEGLVEALGWLQTQMKELHGLDIDIEEKRAARVPDEDMQVFLFQVVRELLFNVVKHAGVDHATVEITGADDHLTICVVDKGHGFDPDGVEEQTQEGGFGLTAARERLELFDGRLEIDSAPGKGTRMTVHVPLDPKRFASSEQQPA